MEPKKMCRWSIIAAQLPGRTDNDIKNYWNTKLKKKLFGKFSSPPFSPLQSQQYLSQIYNSFYTTQATKSLTDTVSNTSSSQNCLNNHPPFFLTNQFPHYPQNQDHQGFQYSNQPVKQNNMLVFGGINNEAASCSSDGSCSQISYGGSGGEDNHKFMLHHYGKNIINGDPILDHHQNLSNGVLDNRGLEYDLEEVIITDDSLLFNDENKNITDHERGVYYY